MSLLLSSSMLSEVFALDLFKALPSLRLKTPLNEILQIVEIEDRYVQNDGRQIYTYEQKISIDINCMGLAPNSMHEKYQLIIWELIS